MSKEDKTNLFEMLPKKLELRNTLSWIINGLGLQVFILWHPRIGLKPGTNFSGHLKSIFLLSLV